MDALELQYDSADDIPSGFSELYSEADGKFVLAKVNGLKTQADVSNVQEALRKEREDHKAAQTSLKAWGDLKPDEVAAQLDKIEEYKIAAEGNMDDDKIESIVESRIKQKTGPMERQISTLTETNTTLLSENEALKASIERRDMNEAVRSVAAEMKVHSSAIPDIEMVAASFLERDESGKFIVKSDAQGVTPGMDIKGFMKEMQKARPHWWPESSGGGAGGGGKGYGGQNNPFSHDGWNVTAQGKVYQEQGAEVAAAMAKAAGTTLGGTKPPKKI
jgi:hypothetical protein